MRGILEIATLLIGVALIALLVNPKANTVNVIRTGGGAFNDLLRTVTLQTGFGVGGGSVGL
jgi:hypothetical protein